MGLETGASQGRRAGAAASLAVQKVAYHRGYPLRPYSRASSGAFSYNLSNIHVFPVISDAFGIAVLSGGL
jgi:hypothetical protein